MDGDRICASRDADDQIVAVARKQYVALRNTGAEIDRAGAPIEKDIGMSVATAELNDVGIVTYDAGTCEVDSAISRRDVEDVLAESGTGQVVIVRISEPRKSQRTLCEIDR